MATWEYIGIIPQGDLPGAGTAYQKEKEVVGAGQSVWLLLPEIVEKLTVTIIMQSAGTARVDYTNATPAVVKADTIPANEILPWANGDVIESTSDACQHVTAVRLNVTSGNWKIQVTASGEK
jgi:hypothetical protein